MKSEFEFIETIRCRSPLSRIGDDCAVVPKDFETDSVITTDLLVEDIDFRLVWTEPEFLGHKALAVSLSDIAAMGAAPVWSMLSIGIPDNIWKTDFVDEFYKGYFRLAEKFNVELIGGDTSRTPDKIVVDSIVAGEVRKGAAILRSGARVGDSIFVSGSLGGAAAGLHLLEEGFRHQTAEDLWRKNLLLKQLKPNPQISNGEFLAKNNLATAMIDLSDGLSSDLAHICRASKTGAKIFADKIPFHKNIHNVAETLERKLNLALNGGEDFELLFTADPKKKFLLENGSNKRRFFHIGEITANVEIIELIIDGKSTILQPKGFRHF